MKIIHYFKVALHFRIWTHEFWLALCHDLVEDGYISSLWCIPFKSLDAITRRHYETYFQYIERCSKDECAKRVKIADIKENIKRCSESLKNRYAKAYNILGGNL